MRDHRPTLGNEIISQSRFAELQQQASEILKLNKGLRKILPRGTENHCRAANIRDGQLILEVASAAIKMKIDYDRLHILNQLRTLGYARLIAVTVVINPRLYAQKSSPEKTSTPRPPISKNAASYLHMIASNASPKVKKRLEQLANMADNQPENSK
ncbi:DciA family protein [Vibrio sp. AK197]